MRQLWIIDAALAMLVPAFGQAVTASVVSAWGDPDPYLHDSFFVLIEPSWMWPLSCSLAVASVWCLRRPTDALRIQLLPALVGLSTAILFAYQLRSILDSMR